MEKFFGSSPGYQGFDLQPVVTLQKNPQTVRQPARATRGGPALINSEQMAKKKQHFSLMELHFTLSLAKNVHGFKA